jgi:hypothetical protein
MLWEAAQFRRRFFDLKDLPEQMAKIADLGETTPLLGNVQRQASAGPGLIRCAGLADPQRGHPIPAMGVDAGIFRDDDLAEVVVAAAAFVQGQCKAPYAGRIGDDEHQFRLL